MMQAYYTGISGMQTSSYGIDVVSDNLANVSTTGFRGSNYEFSSLLEGALSATDGSATSDSIGMGSVLQATPMMEGSGSYTNTDRNTDLAIIGDGWFGVENNGDVAYTRDGAFGFDSNSNLVSNEGEYVLGTMGGNISDDNILTKQLDSVALSNVDQQDKLRFPDTLYCPSQATTTAEFSGNIGSVNDGEVRSMSTKVVDANGVNNELRLDFQALDPQPSSGSQWSVTATTSSLDGETIYATESGVVSFDEQGTLSSSTLTSIDNNGSAVSIDLGSNFDGIVSLTNTGITTSTSVDGFTGGDLIGYDINQDGEVVASFDNGQQSSVGQVAVYHFQNDQGLDRLSGTQFTTSSNSGKAMFYQDTAGNNVIGTTLSSNQLEGSNVDMTYGLTDLIILQRSYDANSKSITTADEMLQKALDMSA